MITRQQLEELQQFQGGAYLVTSCYLDLDRTQVALPMLKIRAKDLLQAARRQLEERAANHPQRESLQRDFERLEQFVIEDPLVGRYRALAVFACAGAKFWQVYRLPKLVRHLLVADATPYVRPLLTVLGQHERYCAVVADSARAQVFEVYLGEIAEHPVMNGDVPRPVRAGGLGGRDERSMERRHAGAVQQHLKQVADKVFDLFKQQQFDRLVLGGSRETLAALKQQLHPYLRQRWAGDFQAEPGRTTPLQVLGETMCLEDGIMTARGQQLAAEVVQQATTGGRAVTGLPATLGVVARGEAQTLVIEEGFEQPGRVCRGCRHGDGEAPQCPRCGQATVACADVVEELAGWAATTICAVRVVEPGTVLHEAGRVGALLRY